MRALLLKLEPIIWLLFGQGILLGTILLSSDRSPVQRQVAAAEQALLGALLLALGIAWALSSRLRGWITGPILNLATTAGRVRDENDYSVRAVKETDDEVGTLAETFNGMLSHIEAADQALYEAKGNGRNQVCAAEEPA